MPPADRTRGMWPDRTGAGMFNHWSNISVFLANMSLQKKIRTFQVCEFHVCKLLSAGLVGISVWIIANQDNTNNSIT